MVEVRRVESRGKHGKGGGIGYGRAEGILELAAADTRAGSQWRGGKGEGGSCMTL
jgi:hypothetical protein